MVWSQVEGNGWLISWEAGGDLLGGSNLSFRMGIYELNIAIFACIQRGEGFQASYGLIGAAIEKGAGGDVLGELTLAVRMDGYQ
jgi:hypothetical protein